MERRLPVIVVFLFMSLVLAGCTNSPASSGAGFHDCGSDFQCFKALASDSCGPAKVTITRAGVTINAQVQPNTENCLFDIQLVDIQLPSTATAQDLDALAALRPLFPQASMACTLTKSESANIDNASFISAQRVLDKCAGPLKDSIRDFGSLFNQTATGNAQACTDSDGGRDYYVAGTLVGGNNGCASGTCEDACYNGANGGYGSTGYAVKEWYCDGQSAARSEVYICQGGCRDGRCISGTANTGTATPTPECRQLWWFDASNIACQQKQFCGEYMYAGLRTFESLNDCLAGIALNGFSTAVPTATATVTYTPTPAPTAAYAAYCRDSDANVSADYAVFGNVTGGNNNCSGNICYDSCASSDYGGVNQYVWEQYCDNSGQAASRLRYCEYGCAYGRCNQQADATATATPTATSTPTPTATPTVTPAGTGSITVSVSPADCNVRINNTNLGTVHSWSTLSGLVPGIYLVTISKTGYTNATIWVAVYAGQDASGGATLVAVTPTPSSTPQYGNITVYTNPTGGRVYLNGFYVGEANPYVLRIMLTPGSQYIVAGKTGYANASTTVWVIAGQTTNATVNLTPTYTPTPTPTPGYPDCASGANCSIGYLSGGSMCYHRQNGYNMYCCPSGQVVSGQACVTPATTGNLSIYVTPSGASVYVDSAYRGTANPSMMVGGLTPGYHVVYAQKSGYNDANTSTTVYAGEVSYASLTLQPTNAAPCVDSDGGRDYYTPGMVTGDINNTCAGGVCYDRCVEHTTFGTRVLEWSCINNAVVSEQFECPINPNDPDGYRCASINNGTITAGACAFRG